MDKHEFKETYHLAEAGDKSKIRDIICYLYRLNRRTLTDEQANILVRYLNILAEENDQEAVLVLGTFYHCGFRNIIPQDYNMSRAYYEKVVEASESKNSNAVSNLGYCYLYGLGGEVDYEKAYNLFSIAASDNLNAMYKLGDMYYNGHFVEKNLDTAFYWYNSAEESRKRYYEDHCEYEHYFEDVDFEDEDYNDYLTASIYMRLGRAFLFGEGTDINIIKAFFKLQIAEALFYKQVLFGDEFSARQLPQTQELLKTARAKLDKEIKNMEK